MMNKLFAESKRLLFYVPTQDDFDFYYELLTNPALTEQAHAGGFNEQQIKAAWDRTMKHWKDHAYGSCLVCLKDTGEKIGFGGFKELKTQTGDLFIDIGGVLKKEVQRKGYAMEGAVLFLDLIFNKFHFDRVGSALNPANPEPIHIVEKLGYKYIKDVPMDTDGVDYGMQRYYELSREEYLKNQEMFSS